MALIKVMDHKRYQEICRKRSEAALRFAIKDCQEVLRVNPGCLNAGFYADEISYCLMELKRRGVSLMETGIGDGAHKNEPKQSATQPVFNDSCGFATKKEKTGRVTQPANTTSHGEQE